MSEAGSTVGKVGGRWYKAKCLEGGSSRKVNKKDVQNEIWKGFLVIFKNIPQTHKSIQVFTNLFYIKYNIEMVALVINKLSLV